MIAEKMSTLFTESNQRQQVISARAKLQNAQQVVIETNADLQTISDAGQFDTIDNELKQALNGAWVILKDAQTALEDETIAELLNWKP